ncbi:RNA-directed DNA polymerase (reverse transcriptase)-related family protein [Rhynchospora pubera]|uniref:RNA-directed DNA polymerase (Reverse transcriptase)-related family protein n=1 Tax=Rhynchospora pubera TaxID=906938 RepID=A0AAV8EMN7_9POAL|nr:RNA-directed DNA polymerase (reverse transcriptase)-related family protein [Rhynchospora pubera]
MFLDFRCSQISYSFNSFSKIRNTILQLFGTRDPNLLQTHTATSTLLKDVLATKALFSRVESNNDLQPILDWRWTADNIFTVASAYKIMSWSGIVSSYHKQLWKMKAPPKVIFFFWLLLRDKLLTQQNLAKRGWPSISACKMCQLQAEETANHLFVSCTFAKEILTRVSSHFDFTPAAAAMDVQSVWLSTGLNLTVQQRALWTSLWAATCWLIWKNRCSSIFSGRQLPIARIVFDIVSTTMYWQSLLA